MMQNETYIKANLLVALRIFQMGIKFRTVLLAAALTSPFFAAAGANATVIYTASGSDSDGSLAGEADITLGAGTITVKLIDTNTGEISSGQTLSGIVFDVSGVTSPVTLGGKTGNLVTFDKNTGLESSDTTDSITHWAANNSGTAIRLVTVGSPASMKPVDLIVGSSPNQNKGFSSHDPYIAGSGTFTLSAPGVTSNSVISDVELLFGTVPTYVDGILKPSVQASVPELSTWVMLLLGFCGLGFLARRRNRIAFRFL